MHKTKWLFTILLITACNRNAEPKIEVGHEEGGHEEGEHEESGNEHGGEHDEHGEGLVRLSPEAVTTVGLETEPAKMILFSQGITASGEIIADPDRMAIIGPGAGGRISTVKVTLGERVAIGTTLLEMESPEISHALGELLEAKALLKSANAAVTRERTLRDKQISSERAVLEAEAQLGAAQAANDTAVAGVRILGLSEGRAVELAKQRSFRIPVRSPLAGNIIDRNAITGQTVDTKDTLFVVADLSRVMVDLQLPESVAFSVKPGASAVLTPVASPTHRLYGRVAYVSPVLTEGSRTVHVRVSVENKSLQLKPRMFVTGRVQTSEATQTLVVPLQAVQQIKGRSTIFVQKEPGEYEPRPVVLGNRDGQNVAVEEGLTVGELVVVKGSFALKAESAKESIGGHDH